MFMRVYLRLKIWIIYDVEECAQLAWVCERRGRRERERGIKGEGERRGCMLVYVCETAKGIALSETVTSPKPKPKPWKHDMEHWISFSVLRQLACALAPAPAPDQTPAADLGLHIFAWATGTRSVVNGQRRAKGNNSAGQQKRQPSTAARQIENSRGLRVARGCTVGGRRKWHWQRT